MWKRFKRIKNLSSPQNKTKTKQKMEPKATLILSPIFPSSLLDTISSYLAYPNRSPKCLIRLKENIGIWDSGWPNFFFILDLQGNVVNLEEETKIKQLKCDSGVYLTLLSFPSVYVLLGDLSQNASSFPFLQGSKKKKQQQHQQTCAIVSVERYNEILLAREGLSMASVFFYENEVLRFSFPSLFTESLLIVFWITTSRRVQKEHPLTESGRMAVLKEIRSWHQGYSRYYQASLL